METKFSKFNAPISNITPCCEIGIYDAWKILANQTLAQATEEIRSVYSEGLFLQKALMSAKVDDYVFFSKDEEEAKKRLLKKICDEYYKKFVQLKCNTLPYVTFSVCCDKRNTECVKTFSGLICFDFDKVRNIRESFFEIVEKTYPVLTFISPSGAGIKSVYEVDTPQVCESGSSFKTCFNELYLDKLSELKSTLRSDLFNCIDPTSNDLMRACFLCNSLYTYISPNYIC